MKTNVRKLANGIFAAEASTGSWECKARRRKRLGQKSALLEMDSMFETLELSTPSIPNRNTMYRQ